WLRLPPPDRCVCAAAGDQGSAVEPPGPAPAKVRQKSLQTDDSLRNHRGQGHNGQHQIVQRLLLTSDGNGQGNGTTHAAIQDFPGTALRVPPTALMCVQGLVIEHHPTQAQEFNTARTIICLQLTTPGFQGAAVVTFDLVSLENATIFLCQADVGTGQQIL